MNRNRTIYYHYGYWYRHPEGYTKPVKDVRANYTLMDTGFGVLNGGRVWCIYGEDTGTMFWRFDEGDEIAYQVVWEPERRE